METRNEKSEPERRELLAPVTALTRFHPDTSGLITPATRQAEYTRYGVKVGATGMLLPYLGKVEIVELDSVCPIPNTPMWFKGMINNRGNLLPVFDLKLFMAVAVDQESGWLMITGHGGRAAGLCIDTLPAVIENPQQVETDWNDEQKTIPEPLRPFVTGLFMHNGNVWADVAYDGLLHELGAKF